MGSIVLSAACMGMTLYLHANMLRGKGTKIQSGSEEWVTSDESSRLTFPFQLHHSGHPKGASEVQNIFQVTFDISLLHAVLRV